MAQPQEQSKLRPEWTEFCTKQPMNHNKMYKNLIKCPICGANNPDHDPSYVPQLIDNGTFPSQQSKPTRARTPPLPRNRTIATEIPEVIDLSTPSSQAMGPSRTKLPSGRFSTYRTDEVEIERRESIARTKEREAQSKPQPLGKPISSAGSVNITTAKLRTTVVLTELHYIKDESPLNRKIYESSRVISIISETHCRTNES